MCAAQAGISKSLVTPLVIYTWQNVILQQQTVHTHAVNT